MVNNINALNSYQIGLNSDLETCSDSELDQGLIQRVGVLLNRVFSDLYSRLTSTFSRSENVTNRITYSTPPIAYILPYFSPAFLPSFRPLIHYTVIKSVLKQFSLDLDVKENKFVSNPVESLEEAQSILNFLERQGKSYFNSLATPEAQAKFLVEWIKACNATTQYYNKKFLLLAYDALEELNKYENNKYVTTLYSLHYLFHRRYSLFHVFAIYKHWTNLAEGLKNLNVETAILDKEVFLGMAQTLTRCQHILTFISKENTRFYDSQLQWIKIVFQHQSNKNKAQKEQVGKEDLAQLKLNLTSIQNDFFRKKDDLRRFLLPLTHFLAKEFPSSQVNEERPEGDLAESFETIDSFLNPFFNPHNNEYDINSEKIEKLNEIKRFLAETEASYIGKTQEALQDIILSIDYSMNYFSSQLRVAKNEYQKAFFNRLSQDEDNFKKNLIDFQKDLKTSQAYFQGTEKVHDQILIRWINDSPVFRASYLKKMHDATFFMTQAQNQKTVAQLRQCMDKFSQKHRRLYLQEILPHLSTTFNEEPTILNHQKS